MQLKTRKEIRLVGQIVRIRLLTVLLLLSLGLVLRDRVEVKRFFLRHRCDLEGNAGTVNQKLRIKAKEKFAALGPPTLTAEDRARPKLGYVQQGELQQCTFLPGEAWTARGLSEPKACSSSTGIRLQTCHLEKRVLVA